MTSRISTHRRADPRVQIPPARYRGVTTETRSALEDRRYIDDQIVGVQAHLEALLLNGVVGTWVRVDPSSDDLAAGDVVCLAATASELRVTLADAAALATAGAALGVALAAVAAGAFGQFAIVGVVPASVTGLAAVAGYARVSSTGRVEKVASIAASDTFLGRIDALGNLLLSIQPEIGSLGVASLGVTAPVLNTGSASSPVIALDCALAATANKVPIRGAAGESSFARVYTGGTVHATAVLSVARNVTIIGAKTGAGDDHDLLVEDGTDGVVYGTRTRSAKHAFRCKTSGFLTVDVDAVEVFRASSTGINVATGLLYQVNGVTVASAPSGIPTLGNTSAANTDVNVASGGSIRLKIDGAERAAVNNDGLLLPTDKALTIGSTVALSAPGNVPTLGSDSAPGDVEIRGSSSTTFNLRINTAVRFAADPTGLAFFGSDPVAQQSVTGSRGGNAALASVLTALANLGLIVDSSSA